jgi:D-glycero-D-manno-heptose 1,7-bisphosphate phosphatase
LADARGLIILDRDGVLNRMLGVAGTPTHDSPMHVAEVDVFPWVPSVLRALTDAGFGLAIASNQPAAAKGKTTRAELEAVHAKVLEEAQRAGGVILSSHICWHRAEDGCACRKPKTGLLEEALAQHSQFSRAASWMVGDRVVDVLAGAALGLFTAFLCDVPAREAFAGHAVEPTFQGADLRDFQRLLLCQ